MGAAYFEIEQIGRDINNAIAIAKEEADDEFGHQQGYSGQINSCYGSIYKLKSPYRYGTKRFNKWLEKVSDDMSKRDIYYLEITGKKAIDIKKSQGFARTRNKVFLLCGYAPE